jgi:small-conductance mechanosensitive channel
MARGGRSCASTCAAGRRILLDQSFASEIQTFSWESYARLLAALYGDAITEQDFLTLSSDLRTQVRQAAATNAAVEAELKPQLEEIEKLAQKARKSPEELRRELTVEILRKYGPALAKLAWKHVGQ